MKDESNKEGFTREDRLKAIKRILAKEPKLTQKKIRIQLDKQGFPTGQGTISKDLKALGYIKHPEYGYIKSDDKALQELKAILSRVISYANPTFGITSSTDASLYALYIYTDEEEIETIISELISILYRNWISSIMVDYGCVTVHFSKDFLAEKMRDELKEYASMI